MIFNGIATAIPLSLEVIMETKIIKSFTIDHDILEKGFYISSVMDDITTYDIRVAKPNSDEIPTISALHTVEHLFACFARSSVHSGNIVYVGPMGCRTGLYFLTRNITPTDALDIFRGACDYILGYEGVILGAASSKECGNWLDHDLDGAKEICARMKKVLRDWNEGKMVYPDR